jgi:CBS domain-containing protein
MNIKELLKHKKHRPIYTVTPEETVFAAVIRMVENNVGAVLVLQNESLCGIMTERDYLRFITYEGKSVRETPVSEIMSRKVIYVTPDCSLNEAMAIMTEKRIRHLPILEGTDLIGIVSIGDVVKEIAQEQEFKIHCLEKYIADEYPGPQ